MKPRLQDLTRLSELTGWNVLLPNGTNLNRYLPQIVLGTRDDENNFACVWWDESDDVYKLASKVNGKHIFNDKKLKYKKLETIVKWTKMCEEKYKAEKMNIKLRKLQKDFK